MIRIHYHPHCWFYVITPQFPLLHHYHPSVALHTRQLLTHAKVTATADLGLNTLSHFLDRFVYRNPKKPRPKGTSAMQPAAYNDGTGMVHAGKAPGAAVDVVNTEGFRKLNEDNVPADQVRFFRQGSCKEGLIRFGCWAGFLP